MKDTLSTVLPDGDLLQKWAGQLEGMAAVLRAYGCLPEAINAECLSRDLIKLANQTKGD